MTKKFTVAEARIIRYSSENARKILHKNGLITGDDFEIDCKALMEISGINEIHRLDRELDHLRSLELISVGFNVDDKNLVADISPTSLALNLYVKSQGYNTDPALYWQDNIITHAEREKERREKEIAEEERQKAEATSK